MSKSWLFILGLVVGVGVLALWRFASYTSEGVHYHANFAVYINGERETFTEPTYYEELAGCDLHEFAQPIERTHMHDSAADLAHVHAPAVTWGNFFENLGWGIGTDFVRTRGQLLIADKAHLLTYLLNGQHITNPANHVIGNEDKLLVSYGTTDEAQLQTQLASVPTTAREQNLNPDPAGCGGATTPTWSDRLRHIFN